MMSFAVSAIMKVTLVCGVAFLLAHLCRRTRASIRHVLFTLAFIALVAIPLAGPLLPTVAVSMPAISTAPVPRTQDMASDRPSSTSADASVSSPPSVSSEMAFGRSTMIARTATATWLIGVALFLIPVVVGFWQVRRLRHEASPWIDGHALVQTLAPRLGVRRPIGVLLHEGIMGPLTCGVLVPTIILPATADQWDETTLRCALSHELEHVARWDFLTHGLSRMVCAAYWFHPVVWAAWRRLRLEAERACDDAVLREDDAADYAALLVSIAQREQTNRRQPLLAMAGRDDLTARVAAVLDGSRARGRVGRGRSAWLFVTGTIVILSVAAITIERAVAQVQPAADMAPFARFETASIERSQDADVPSRIELFRVFAGGPMATNVTVRSLLFVAFGHPNGVRGPHQIDNAPEWVDSDRFDIVAKAPPGATPEQAVEMLQSLLAERFNLVAHHGSREFPIYALVLARQGWLGPQMTPSQFDCRSKPGESSTCGLSGTGSRVAGRGITMAQLVRLLPKHLDRQVRFDRPVIDRTGLSGTFDFTLEWTRDPVAQDSLPPSQAAARLPGDRAYAFPLESNAPNFLTALRDELGLHLEDQLAPEPVLVIDEIQRPAEN